MARALGIRFDCQPLRLRRRHRAGGARRHRRRADLDRVPGMDNQMLILSFVVVVIGGIGSVAARAIGALLIGTRRSFGKVFFPSFSSFTVYVLMAAVLLWRPTASSAGARSDVAGGADRAGACARAVAVGDRRCRSSPAPTTSSSRARSWSWACSPWPEPRRRLRRAGQLLPCGVLRLAGYALALAAPQYEAASIWITLPAAVGAAALAALVIGALSLRTRGIYFIMVTLAFGEMMFFLFHDTRSPAARTAPSSMSSRGGDRRTCSSISRRRGPSTGSSRADARRHRAPRMPSCARPSGTRSRRAGQRARARSLGFPIYRIRLTAFVISGALAGLAGYFAAAQFGYVARRCSAGTSRRRPVMVVLGGMRTVTGPLVGAAILMGSRRCCAPRPSTGSWSKA